MIDWKTHIKLMGRYWLREPGPDDRNTKEELQFLAGLLDESDPKVEWVCEGGWSQDCCLDPCVYHRPYIDLPVIPDGYVLFGQGKVPDELCDGCLMNSGISSVWLDAEGDSPNEVYIVRADLWESAVNPPVCAECGSTENVDAGVGMCSTCFEKGFEQTEWERWCGLVAQETSEGKAVHLHRTPSGWNPSHFNPGVWVARKDRRIVKEITRPRTPEEWRDMAIAGEWVRGDFDGYIGPLQFYPDGFPEKGLRKLWCNGIEQPVHITETVTIAEWLPDNPEGERIVMHEGGAE